MGDGTTLVMVVDDDPCWREALVQLLELEGLEAISAANGVDALATLRRAPRRPDALVTDLSMPLMNGWQLRIELLRDPALASIPVTVVSGDDLRGVPAAHYLRKPCDPDELIAAVKAMTRIRCAA